MLKTIIKIHRGRKMIYLLRHCKATGQEYNAKLTSEGKESSIKLIPILSKLNINEIHCSPMTRAIDTVIPFAEKNKIHINTTEVLQERILSFDVIPDWKSHLEKTFLDFDYKLEMAESSNDALKRIFTFVKSLENDKNHLIVSHGNLLSLLINKYDKKFGFMESLKMENSDLFKLDLINEKVEHLGIDK